MRVLLVAAVALASLLSLGSVAEAAPPSWYPTMRWLPAASANFSEGRAGTPVTFIVIHATDGTYAGTQAWFRQPHAKVSAHYVIRARDGEITQMVAEKDTAFHARGSNVGSIGIEHEFSPRDGITYTDAQRRSSAQLVCAIARRYGIPLDRAHVVGHAETPRADHPDPGPAWDWAGYMRLLQGCAGGVLAQSVDVPDQSLSFGARSSQVTRLQSALARLGYMSQVTGYFGPITDAAVRRFQRDHGVDPVGVYGPRTRAALTAALR
ncbi:MAG TPA: N-acetylmuramoyl-L-alanine amidase [Candidatus Limnocylindria bacterium]|nr:N-acetylmuramoyl-L-alanine amidase [Candidatus Limnocylindria bacterium]